MLLVSNNSVVYEWNRVEVWSYYIIFARDREIDMTVRGDLIDQANECIVRINSNQIIEK